MFRKKFLLVFSATIALCFGFGFRIYANQPFVPVYFIKNHAGAFYKMALFSGNEKIEMIHMDSHSDATAIAGSDFIREILEKNNSPEKTRWLEKWIKRSIVQSYNWLEPLIPEKVNHVTWIIPPALKERKRKLKEFLSEEANSYTNIEERNVKDLTGYFSVRDSEDLNKINFNGKPYVLSLDLDYFMDMNNDQTIIGMNEILEFIGNNRNIRGVFIALSRPYLHSDKQMNFLLYQSLVRFSSIMNSVIHFCVFEDYGTDKSLMAQEYIKQGKRMPEFELDKIDISLKSFFISHNEKIRIDYDDIQWKKKLSSWKKEIPVLPQIQGYFIPEKKSCRRRCIIGENENLEISLINIPSDKQKIKWYLKKASRDIYNLMDENEFAINRPDAVFFSTEPIAKLEGKKDFQIRDLDSYFDQKTGWGAIRIFASVITEDGEYQTDEFVISRSHGRGFTGYLSEIFNLPYIFGSAYLRNNDETGPDTMFGSECSTFVIYAARRQGYQIPYVNPVQLESYLDTIEISQGITGSIALNDEGNQVKINKDEIFKGLILHFGSHVAVLYEDKDPVNLLSENDLVMHHLGGYAEVIALGELIQSRKTFKLMQFNRKYIKQK